MNESQIKAITGEDLKIRDITGSMFIDKDLVKNAYFDKIYSRYLTYIKNPDYAYYDENYITVKPKTLKKKRNEY